MAAVTGVNQTGNTSSVNRVLSLRAAPEFGKTAVMPALIYSENMPENQGTATKGFRKIGSIATPSILAEATAGALAAVRTDTQVDATAAKAVSAVGVSIESIKYTMNTLGSYTDSSARAIARAVDNQILGLFPSVTEVVDCAGALTLDDMDEAALKIMENECPEMTMNMRAVLGSRGVRQLKADIRTSGGAAFSNEKFLDLFNGVPQVNGYVGQVPGFDIFHVTSGLTDVSGQNSQCIFHPIYAFAGIFDSQVNVIANTIGVGGLYYELVSYFFWDAVLWNDGAACEILSSGS